MTKQVAKKPEWHVSRRARQHARSLRRNATKAEHVVWRLIRAHRLNGTGFRRQTPIGPYIVDFVSHSAKLVIELDGGQHFDDAHAARDAKRDKYLRAKGYRVLRINNHDVMRNLDGAWEVIAAAVGATASLQPAPPPLPPPQAGQGFDGGEPGAAP